MIPKFFIFHFSFFAHSVLFLDGVKQLHKKFMEISEQGQLLILRFLYHNQFGQRTEYGMFSYSKQYPLSEEA